MIGLRVKVFRFFTTERTENTELKTIFKSLESMTT